jgi:hypothetical protein
MLISYTHWPIQVHFQVTSAQNTLCYGQPAEANIQMCPCFTASELKNEMKATIFQNIKSRGDKQF